MFSDPELNVDELKRKHDEFVNDKLSANDYLNFV